MPPETKTKSNMTPSEMNIQIIRDLAEIADDENLMEKLSKYLKKLVAQKKNSAAMTQEEFLAKLERGERAYECGDCHEMLANEDVTTYLRRRGYDL